MIKEIQFQRSKQRIFAMDENYKVIAGWPCSDRYWPGWNDLGDPRASLPDGVHQHVSAEVTYGKYGPAFGNFYITSGDPRGRDIHGGGSNCEDPYADYQPLTPTYGCLRMHNADGVELSQMIIESGNNVVLTVVEE